MTERVRARDGVAASRAPARPAGLRVPDSCTAGPPVGSHKMPRVCALALAALLLAPPAARAAVGTPDEMIDREDPTGEDPTRPRPELLLRYRYENLPGGAPDSLNAFVLEAITAVPIAERWNTRFRLEMPLVLTNVPASDDADAAWRFGSGDLLSEAAGIYYPDDRWALALGGQMVFPTASRAATGAGAWVLGAGGLVRAMLPELSPDSFFATQIVYGFDVGGRCDREHVSAPRLQPLLHWALPHAVFLELFPSDDLVVNLGAPAGRGRLFLPFDALAGILWTPKVVTTLELGVPLVKQYPVYDFKIVATVGYFFD